MNTLSAIVVAATLSLSSFAHAQTCTPDSPQTPPAIESMSWLAGRWVGLGLGGEMEEVWSPPAGGQMVGHFSLMSNGQPYIYEISLIDAYDGGLRMRVKHFTRAFVGWEEKDAWHTFEFCRAAPNELILDGLEMRRAGDVLSVRLSLAQADGSIETEELRFTRAPFD